MKVFFSKILGLNDSMGFSSMEHANWILQYGLNTVYSRERQIAEKLRII